MPESRPILVACAGWSLPKQHADRFASEGSHLERYASRIPAVEINSSFYRPHREATYVRWAASTPADFRFAVKMPKTITHERRLRDCEALLDQFLNEVGGLGDKLGPLLVQLPPSMRFEQSSAEVFFTRLRACFGRHVACEPRHPSWFDSSVDELLIAHRIARVAADPSPMPGAERPGGWDGMHYHRLHGTPKIYYSNYDANRLDVLADNLQAEARVAEVWCVFDNTAEGHATLNAVQLLERLG